MEISAALPIGVHRARLNLVPLNGSSSWRTGDRRCRRCGYITESLAHVVCHCMRYTGLYMRRHNSIVDRIKKAAEPRFAIISENQAIGTQRLRPDLVLRRGNTTLIIDVTIPFDNRLQAFENSTKEKTTKYEDFRKEILLTNPGEAKIIPFIIGALGSWDPNNDGFVNLLINYVADRMVSCSESYV